MGVLTSPSYPDYYNTRDQNCIYTISLANGTSVKLDTVVMDTGKHEDYIEIRDGNSKQSPLIGIFSGKDIPKSMQTTKNMLWMRYCVKDE